MFLYFECRNLNIVFCILKEGVSMDSKILIQYWCVAIFCMYVSACLGMQFPLHHPRLTSPDQSSALSERQQLELREHIADLVDYWGQYMGTIDREAKNVLSVPLMEAARAILRLHALEPGYVYSQLTKMHLKNLTLNVHVINAMLKDLERTHTIGRQPQVPVAQSNQYRLSQQYQPYQQYQPSCLSLGTCPYSRQVAPAVSVQYQKMPVFPDYIQRAIDQGHLTPALVESAINRGILSEEQTAALLTMVTAKPVHVVEPAVPIEVPAKPTYFQVSPKQMFARSQRGSFLAPDESIILNNVNVPIQEIRLIQRGYVVRNGVARSPQNAPRDRSIWDIPVRASDVPYILEIVTTDGKKVKWQITDFVKELGLIQKTVRVLAGAVADSSSLELVHIEEGPGGTYQTVIPRLGS